jgi:hypothetical protein
MATYSRPSTRIAACARRGEYEAKFSNRRRSSRSEQVWQHGSVGGALLVDGPAHACPGRQRGYSWLIGAVVALQDAVADLERG